MQNYKYGTTGNDTEYTLKELGKILSGFDQTDDRKNNGKPLKDVQIVGRELAELSEGEVLAIKINGEWLYFEFTY